MIEQLYNRWIELSAVYCKNKDYLEQRWKEICKQYSNTERSYHNLNHINKMLEEAEKNKLQLKDYDAVLFSIWFHDIIYKPSRSDNEYKSAVYAREVLQNLELEGNKINKVSELIISTKKHQVLLDENKDNAFFLDFDLSILGQPWKMYQKYINSIRKEYRLYPDFMYKPGRKKVLKSFLSRKTIYFTDKYRVLYEEQARLNIEKELNLI